MTPELLLAVAAIALGGLLKGATGAGAPIVAVPVLAMLYDVSFAVAVFVVPNLVTNAWQYLQFRRQALPARFTWAFAAGGATGVVLGAWALATVRPEALLLTVACAVFAYIGFRLARPGWTLPFARALPLAAPIGGLAGILQGASGVSAPISITFLNALRPSRPEFIGTISAFFGLVSVVQLPAMAAFGLLSWDRLAASTLAVLPLVGFMPVGEILARRISPKAFDRAILTLLALISLRLVWTALG